MTFVEYVLGDAIMPGLHDPVFSYGDVFSFIGQGVVPHDARFLRLEAAEPFDELLKQRVIIMRVPDVCHFIAAKMMQGCSAKVLVNSGNHAGYGCVGFVFADVHYSVRVLQVWMADHQILLPQAPTTVRSGNVLQERRDKRNDFVTYQMSQCPGMSVSG